MIKSHKSYHFLTNQFYALASFLRPLLGWLEREEYDPAVDAIFSWTRPVKSKCGSSNSVQSPPTSSRLQSNTESCLAMLNPHFKFKKTANLFFFFFLDPSAHDEVWGTSSPLLPIHHFLYSFTNSAPISPLLMRTLLAHHCTMLTFYISHFFCGCHEVANQSLGLCDWDLPSPKRF